MIINIPRIEWKHFGHAAHFIGGSSCRFHLATKVGSVIVSTVGEFVPDGHDSPMDLGLGKDSKYETMAFTISGVCDCGCGLPTHEGGELFCRRYKTAEQATKGHEETCLEAAKGAI